MRFPGLVAQVPMRTHAILTKYTELQSFQDRVPTYIPPVYESTVGYTNVLQDAFFGFQTLYKTVNLLMSDVGTGLKTLKAAEQVELSSASGEYASIRDYSACTC